MQRRWIAALLVGLVAMAAVPVILFVLSGSPSVPTTGSPPATTASAASPEPTGGAPSPNAGRMPFATATSPEDAAWYRIGADLTQFPAHLQVGTMADGVTLDMVIQDGGPDAIVPGRPVVGVAAGIVVIVEDDGHRSSMRAIVASTGEIHDLVAEADLILDAVLAPDGREVFYLTAERATGTLVGAWRLSLDTIDGPRRIEALVSGAPGVQLAAVTSVVTRFLISPDGTTLGLWRCLELDCGLRAVRIADGSLLAEASLRRGGGSPFGITQQFAFLSPECVDGPDCLPKLLELSTGEIRPMGVEPWHVASESVFGGAGGPLAAIQSGGYTAPPPPDGQLPDVPPQISILDLDELAVGPVFSPPLSALRVLPSDDYSIGVDLPTGWFLIQGSEPGDRVLGAYAVDAADGALVPLPALGEIFVQG